MPPCIDGERKRPEPAGDHCIGVNSSYNLTHKARTIGYHPEIILVEVPEQCLCKKTDRDLLQLQPRNVPHTYAEVRNLVRNIAHRPATTVARGMENFVVWYRNEFQVA